MITVYYTEVDAITGDGLWSWLAHEAPVSVRERITNYTSRQEQAIRICGKILLSQLLKHYALDIGLSLADIEYNKRGRPFFNTNFDFNIAHSAGVVICAGGVDIKIGADIEEIKDIDTELMKDYFTPKEWKKINNSPSHGVFNRNMFYQMWVRKEAYLKAVGHGLFLPLYEIDVRSDEIKLNDSKWYLRDIFIKENYAACIATNVRRAEIHITKIELNTLIN